MEQVIVSRVESSETSPSCPSKKKYSKVNEALKGRFLEYIVQENMSIKEVSFSLFLGLHGSQYQLQQCQGYTLKSPKIHHQLQQKIKQEL